MFPPKRNGLLCTEEMIKAYRACLAPPDEAWPHDVQRMVVNIHDRLYDEGILIADLERRCGIRDKHFSSRFERYMGRTPKGYLDAHRIEAAKQALRRCEVKIVRVALALGYARPNTFTMAFRKHLGCTPAAYQASHRGKN